MPDEIRRTSNIANMGCISQANQQFKNQKMSRTFRASYIATCNEDRKINEPLP